MYFYLKLVKENYISLEKINHRKIARKEKERERDNLNYSNKINTTGSIYNTQYNMIFSRVLSLILLSEKRASFLIFSPIKKKNANICIY